MQQRKHLSLILLLFLLSNSVLSNTSGQITKTKSHVIITAGQSNTDGRVKNELLPTYIKKYATDTVEYKNGEYNYCKISRNSNNGKFSPFFPKGRISDGLWAYDAVTYYLLEQYLKEDFYVVKYAVGGTSIQYSSNSAKGRYWSADKEWLAQTKSFENGGNSLLLSFTEAIDSAIDNTLSKLENGYQIDAFLWHQGESDDRYENSYYENLKAVINYVREYLTEKTGQDYSRLPFIFGSVPQSNKCYSLLVDAAMRRIAEEDDYAYLVDMSGYTLQKDRLHFDEKSAEYLGKEMYKILAKTMNLNRHGFSVAKYRDDKAAAISYTFDDGLQEHYTLVAPAFDKLGFKATFWINGDAISQWETDPKPLTEAGKPRMTWAQIKEMAASGHEISSHGWAHKNLTRLHGEALRYEIQHNDTAIFKNTGVFPRTFCYPGNVKNDTSVMVASRDRIATRLLQFSVGGKSTCENLEKRMEDLIAGNKWGVTMTHGITYGYDHFSNDSILWDHLLKVKAKENKIWVGTFSEIAAYTKEQKAIFYEIKDIEDGFVVVPELKLDSILFKEPLTAVIKTSDKNIASIYQGNNEVKFQISPNEILFDFNPYGGDISIKYGR